MASNRGEEPLPCPHCGGQPELHHPTGASYANITYILCDGCGAVTSFRPNLKGSEAIAAWNRRALAAAPSDNDGGDARDAARYRWLREQDGATVHIEEFDDDGDSAFVSGHEPGELDAAIDAALAAKASP